MTIRSLRFRLVVAWAVFIVISLQLAGIALRVMFERAIMRRTLVELNADVRQLIKGSELDAEGRLRIAREPTDPQFDIVNGGRYWQVRSSRGEVLHSRSLTDFVLDYNAPVAADAQDTAWIAGPKKQLLFAVVQRVTMQAPGDTLLDFALIAAVDAAEIGEETSKYSSDLFYSIAGLTVLFIAGAWIHVAIGLRPLEQLRSSVSSVRAGKARQVEGEFPEEIMPLVLETNALLDAQDVALRKARARASDLAHGLKTPLAVIGAKSRQLRREGADAIAADLDRQVDSMRRHVDREMARARARGARAVSQVRVDACDLLDILVTALRGLPKGEQLEWKLDWPTRLDIAVDPDDFNNMIGNLADNALKWASTTIHVVAYGRDGKVAVVVEDDGPGVAESDLDRILLRGERADTKVQGSGLGLSIVSDLVELYGGELKLSRSSLGGLRSVLVLPA